MKTTKSYLAGLGMTGIVIASILSLLVVGTGLVAFDGGPEPRSANGPLERVVVDDEALVPERGSARRRARPAAALAARAENFRAALGALAVRATQGTAGGRGTRRPASRSRAGRAHGGAQVARAFVLGGGARAGDARAGKHGSRPGRDERSPGGEHARRRGETSGGGAAVPRAMEPNKVPKAPRHLMKESRARGNEPPALPPGQAP
jgi:hypothetical protein